MGAYSQAKIDLSIEEELESMIVKLHSFADRAGVRVIEIGTNKSVATDGRYGTVTIHNYTGAVEIRHLDEDGDFIGVLKLAREKTPDEAEEE